MCVFGFFFVPSLQELLLDKAYSKGSETQKKNSENENL